MNKYKKALEEILTNSRELTETQGVQGFYLVSRVNTPKTIKTLRRMVSKLQRKGLM